MSNPSQANNLWFPPPEFYTAELCSRCGICCGSTDGDPCRHLQREADGSCFCDVYEKRLGLQRTVNGSAFLCVPIQRIIEQYSGYADCAYVKEICRIRKQMGQDTSDLGRMPYPSV